MATLFRQYIFFLVVVVIVMFFLFLVTPGFSGLLRPILSKKPFLHLQR